MYYLEMIEDGHRLPWGDPKGYKTEEEAVRAAEAHVDDALPRNVVRVYQYVGHAYFGGDGGSYFKHAEEG